MLINIARVESGVDDSIALAESLFKGTFKVVLLSLRLRHPPLPAIHFS
jgi:hypothetical protein